MTAAAPVEPDEQHDAYVLHGRPLRPGATLADTARFSDPMWRLGPAVLQQHRPATGLNFDTVPARFRAVTRELFYTLLSGPWPAGERPLGIATITRLFSDLKPFLTWLDAHCPGRALAELTGADLQDYARDLAATVPRPGARAAARVAVRMLWRHRAALPSDRLRFDPRHLDGWGESAKRAPENTTDRVPEPVLGPLITWSLRFVDEFAPDILAAHLHWQELRDPSRYSGIARGVVADRLRRQLQAHREHDIPIPGRYGQPNFSVLAMLARCPPTAVPRYRKEIQAVAAEVGLATYSAVDVPITATLDDGQPWTPEIVSDHCAAHGLAVLTRQLQIACYIVIAYLSGARDSEIKHLQRGCLRVHRDPAGHIYRHTMTSRAFKGERDPTGTPATWVIGEPAARAITILEQLQPVSTALLFAALTTSSGAGPAARATNAALNSTTTNRQLTEFVRWVNTYCATTGRQDTVPQVNGRDWPLSARQFRRTLAWFIARRPGGVIAGAIQYRHQAIQMFEGYAGSSESGFRAEVESEQALARGEHLLAMIDRHDHHSLTGPAADEAARRLERLGEDSHYAGTVITDPQRLKRLQRQDPAIYPGTHVTCVFNPDTALCLAPHRRRDQAQHPHLADCRPLDCTNVALTPDNVATWRAELDTIDRQLTGPPPLPPLLAARLRERRDAITAFLTNDHGGQP